MMIKDILKDKGYPQGYRQYLMIFEDTLKDILNIQGYLKVSLRISLIFKDMKRCLKISLALKFNDI